MGRTCLGEVGIRREMKEHEDDEDDNVGMEFTVVVHNRQFPITGTVPKKNSIQYRRIQGTDREHKCRLMNVQRVLCIWFNIQIWS